jgi:membrane-associated phospholipid phosphatase
MDDMPLRSRPRSGVSAAPAPAGPTSENAAPVKADPEGESPENPLPMNAHPAGTDPQNAAPVGPARVTARRPVVASVWATLLVAALVFAGLLVAVRATWSPLESFDHWADVRLNHLVAGHSGAVMVIKAVTWLGTAPVRWAVVLVAVILLAVGRRWAAVIFPLIAGAGGLLGPPVKSLAARPRPVLAHPVAHAGGASFPSGHALGSLVCYGGVLLVLLPLIRGRWRPALVAVTVAGLACIGASRLLLGVHFFSDVVAGWALGTVWLAAVWLLMTMAATSRLAPTWLSATWPPATWPPAARPAAARAGGGSPALPAQDR